MKQLVYWGPVHSVEQLVEQVLQGLGTIYIEGHRGVLEITTDILNNFADSKYVSVCLSLGFHS
jgi:hypothetical protein